MCCAKFCRSAGGLSSVVLDNGDVVLGLCVAVRWKWRWEMYAGDMGSGVAGETTKGYRLDEIWAGQSAKRATS